MATTSDGGHLSPQGTPPTSPMAGQAMDGNEMAARILQAAEAAAQAATSTAQAVQFFRQQAESGTSSSSKATDWFKLLPKPSIFDPKDYDQEISQWREWFWGVNQYLCALDHQYETEVRYIENHTEVFQDPSLMGDDEKRRSMFLYGLLAALLRGRLLTVLRGVADNNGYEALRQLLKQCQPTSRNRSLGILNAVMGWKEFDMKASLLSQIVKLEEAFREYDKISAQALASEMKFAILLRCITGQLRMHINVSLREDATYEALREMILQYDRANIKWTEAMALGNSRPSGDGGPAPMDIYRVKGAKRRARKENQKEKTSRAAKASHRSMMAASRKAKTRARARKMENKERLEVLDVERVQFQLTLASFAEVVDIGVVNAQCATFVKWQKVDLRLQRSQWCLAGQATRPLRHHRNRL